ncbi:hypothetical protein RJ498_000474 [Pluralibacter gergoviae]
MLKSTMQRIALSTSAISMASLLFTSLSSFAAAPPPGKLWAGSTYFNWNITKKQDGTAATGSVNELTFPFTINDSTARSTGVYLAQQYFFENQTSGGYLGLQPQNDAGGKQRIRAVFSSFIPGSVSTDKNCSSGADGGAGVSCGVIFETNYGSTYNITIHQTSDDEWSGDLIDSSTGKTVHVGSYKLPAKSGGLKLSGAGFLEYFSGDPEWTTSSCGDLLKLSGVIGPVYTSQNGGAIGIVEAPYEQDSEGGTVCRSPDSGFSSSPQNFDVNLNGNTVVATGQTIERGFTSGV